MAYVLQIHVVSGIRVDNKWAGGPYSKCLVNIVSFPIAYCLIDCCVFGMLPGKKVCNSASTVWVNGKSCWPKSFSAWIGYFVLYDRAGPGPSSIFCVCDPIRGTKPQCPMTQPFVLKVLSGLSSLLLFPARELRVVAFFILSLAALWVLWALSISLGL